jgi:hypothetical protein
MHLIKTPRAIARLLWAEARVKANDRREHKAGTTGDTPRFLTLNRAVDHALQDPHLPDRYQDPADLTP